MRKSTILGFAALGLLLCLPLVSLGKDKESGERIKIKKAKVVQMVPEQGTAVVMKEGNVYNVVFALADPDKFELLSKYGIQEDPMALKEGDWITCRGRRFSQYFVPSKCRLEPGSQDDLYKDKKGYIVADVYAVDPVNGLIYAAHSLNKTDITPIKVGDTKITYKGENRSLSKVEPYWRLLVKGVWSKSDQVFKQVKKIKILEKHKNAPSYGF